MKTHVRNSWSLLGVAVLALVSGACSTSKPKLGLDTSEAAEPDEIDLDEEARRVRELQLVRVRYDYSPAGTSLDVESDGEAVETAVWAALVCGGEQARTHYQYAHGFNGTSGVETWSEAQLVELRLCMARAYARMAQSARGPIVVKFEPDSNGNFQTLTIPVQSGGARVTLLARAAEYAQYAWRMARSDLRQYLTSSTHSFVSGEDNHPGVSIGFTNPQTVVEPEAAEQAKLLGPILREAYDRFQEYHDLLIDQIVAVSDAELASTASTSLAAFRGVERDVLSRSWAAHLLVGGEPGLGGLPGGKFCSTPALSPQAQRAIDIFRRAAPNPEDILNDDLSITELLNSNSEGVGSIRRRLVALFDEAIPNSVEERFQLRTQDFVEARQYLQDELRVFARKTDHVIPGSDPDLPRYAAVANQPTSQAAYWAAVARSSTAAGDLDLAFGLRVQRFLSEAKGLLRDKDGTDEENHDAIFGPIASIVSDAQEQYLGSLDHSGYGGASVTLTHEANAKLKKVRVVKGEHGLSCATLGTIEGVPCTASDLADLSRGLVEQHNDVDGYHYALSSSFDFIYDDKIRLYVVHSPEGSEDPGHFRALGGTAARGGIALTPRLDERAATILEPNEKWCTQPKVGCAEGNNQFSFDARLPLENDLADDGDAIESSWRYYLNKAKEAAVDADQLGEAYILANLEADNRKETIEMREEARRAEAEEALSRLQTTCGTDVDPVALFNLLANGDVNEATDLSSMRDQIDCTTNEDCNSKPGFVCMANSCIVDIPKYLDEHAVNLNPKLTEGLHRLSECIGATTSTPFISLGNQPLCVFYLDTPSQLCQTTGTDKATACPALAEGTTSCTPCRSPTQTNCYQVPQGANNARYHATEISGDNLLGFFDTTKAQLHLSPRNECNFISDTLRWDPQALSLSVDGVQTQVGVTEEVAALWAQQIRANGLFHPAGNIKDIIKRIGFYTSFGATTGSGITFDNQVRFTPATKGNLWWYGSDGPGLAAVLALKLSYPEFTDPLSNVSFPYYIYTGGGGDATHVQTRSFLWGGVPHTAADVLAFTDSTEKRRYLNGGETICEDTWFPFDAEACTKEFGRLAFAYTTVTSTGQNPDVRWGYGSEPGDVLYGDVHLHMAIGTWPKAAPPRRPKSAWWWNGFSYATPLADPDGAQCEGGCNDLLTKALLERRDLELATPFKDDARVVGDVRLHPRAAMQAMSLTTTDLLRGAQLACELVEFERSFRCDPANPPAVNSVHDLAAVRQAMDCTANMIEGRAAQTVFAQFPERARNALRQQGVVGAFPQVGGEIGKMTSDIAGTLIGIKQAVADVAVEAKLVGLALDQLRTDAALKDVRDQIVDINFQASVANLVTGCLKESAAAVGLESVIQPGNVAAAAIGCANAVIQIDLAGKLQTAQQAENQLVYLSALNSVRENLTTRAANMQRLRSQLLTDISNLDGQLAMLETARYDARRQLSRALYKASSQAKSEPALTNVYANRATVSEKRYQNAYQRAVKLAFLARRAVEMRLGVDLSTLGENYPLVEAPATWATTLCSSTGVDYDQLRKDSEEFRATFQTSFQEQYIGSYVQKLEDFVEAYRLRHSFKEGQDTVVASLRDDILGVKTTCEVDSINKISSTSRVDRAWGPVGCASDVSCIRAVTGNESGAPAYAPADSELREASPVAVWLGNEDGTACVAPACGYAAKAGLVQKVFPKENLFPQTYVLSWYYPTQLNGTPNVDGPNLMEVLTEDLQPLTGTTSGTVSTSRVPGWKRSYVRFKLEKSQTLALRIGGKLDATAQGKKLYLAAPMLEAASGKDPLPSAFEGADEAGKREDNACGDPNGEAFRRQNWRRDCIKLCGDGYAAHCSDVNATTACYREVSFSLSQRDIELGRVLASSGFAQGNYNYRLENIGINLVGTGLHDCSDSEAPETCYGSGNVQFSLIHSGPYVVRNHMGHDYEAQLFTGRIEHARALATERYITNPMSSTDRDLLQTFLRAEFAGRPLDGRYALRLWESPSFDFNSVEDVQLVMNYRYWTRN